MTRVSRSFPPRGGPTRPCGSISRLRGGAIVLAVASLAFLPPNPAFAQVPVEWDAAREQMSRVELENLLEQIRENLASTAYSGRLREQLQQNAEMIQRRLEVGDFQVGDRIVLLVEGEPDLSDTLTVRAGPGLSVPVVGDVTLRGVLRSELEEHLARELGRFYRNPRVRAHALIRISVIGEVESPGFFVVPAEGLVTDALMVAGGPTREARLGELRVERGSVRIWDGELLQEAVIQGRTLDQMNIQAGDRIVVPRGVTRTGWERFQIIAASVGALGSIAFIVSQFF
jgi:protein involved in polysaccharide export with SLBB domain